MSERTEQLLAQAREAKRTGDLGAAVERFREAAALARASGPPTLLGYVLRHLSEVEREAGDRASALAHGREAIDIYRSVTDASGLDLANALRVTALASDDDRALALWREARDLYAQCGVEAGVREADAHSSY